VSPKRRGRDRSGIFTGVLRRLDALSWWAIAVAVLALGLAPWGSTPHLVDKTSRLARGEALRPVDWGDLVYHGWPIALLAARAARVAARRKEASS